MFCTDCVQYRIILQAIKLLTHVSSSLKVFPSGISPQAHLYFYCMLKAKHVFVQKPLSLSNFSSIKTPIAAGYFSTIFLSLCNISHPHRCVISKPNSSKRTLQLNRPVILNQGVKCSSSYPHAGTGMWRRNKGREKTKNEKLQKNLC